MEEFQSYEPTEVLCQHVGRAYPLGLQYQVEVYKDFFKPMWKHVGINSGQVVISGGETGWPNS